MSEYPKNLVTPTEQSEPEMPLPEKILDPIEPTKKKKPFILIAIIVIVGLILIAIGLLMFMNNGNGLVPGVEPTPTPENGTEPTPTPTEQIVAPERGYRYVAYAKEDPNSNIWVIDTQGGNQKKITDNNDASTYYPQVDWKAFDIVVYTECSHITNVCSIWQTSIYTGQTESVVSADKFVTDAAILAFGISEDGNQVAYIYSVADGRAFVQLQKDGKSSTLKELPPSLGRDGTFDDTVSVEFSPDGRLLLITDPLTQPNTKQDFTTMWIYDTSDGTELFGLGKQNKFASMGIWLSNDTIIYKFDGNLIRKNVATQGESTIAVFDDLYNPQLSPDGNQILAWKYPVSRRPQITTLSLSTKQFSNHSLNFIEPDWVTLADTIALETRETTGSVTFTPTGRLMRVNVQNSSIFELEPANVTTFSVEPLRS